MPLLLDVEVVQLPVGLEGLDILPLACSLPSLEQQVLEWVLVLLLAAVVQLPGAARAGDSTVPGPGTGTTISGFSRSFRKNMVWGEGLNLNSL